MSIIAPTLTIDRAALQENYRLFQSMTGAEVAGVVKADGYGVGLEEVSAILLTSGCRTLFVATPDEALRVRALNGECRVAVLAGPYHGVEGLFAERNITPVINSLEQLARWQDQARKAGRALPYILHVDTGMNRLGLSAAEWQQWLSDKSLSEGLRCVTIMSHFIASDEAGHPCNKAQRDAFAKIAAEAADIPKSLCNSSGLFRFPDHHYDLVRPGVALYGANPTPEAENPVKAVVSLSVPILQTRQVKKGESIGYGATYHFGEDTTTATLALGYADGFARAGSNRAKVYISGQACPVLGRISMDLVSIGTGHLKTPPRPGEMVEILGPSQGVDALAGDMGTISYEILTSLGKRYKRDYIG